MTTEVVPERPRASTGGIVATIILCVFLLFFTVGMAVLSLLLSLQSDACGSGTVCDDNGISTGILVAFFGCAGAGLLGIVLGIIWAARRKRLAWLFPIAAGLVVLGFWIVGLVLVSAAAHVSLS